MSDEFFELMERVNPFAFKDEKGKICVFKDYSEAYLDCIDKLRQMGFGGWVDLVVFMNKHCGFEMADAERFMKHFENSGALSKNDYSNKTGLVQIDWTDYKDMQRVLPRIMCGLHWVLETKFNPDMFKHALDRWCVLNGVVIE